MWIFKEIKLKNLVLGIKDQLPITRLIRNMWSGNVFGLFFKRSHLNFDGKQKVAYGSKRSAIKAAQKMTAKKGVYFSNYKCIYCDGYHLGKNRTSVTKSNWKAQSE